MDTVNYIDVTQIDSSAKTFAIITHPDGSYTSMLKSDYEATLAANSATPQA